MFGTVTGLRNGVAVQGDGLIVNYIGTNELTSQSATIDGVDQQVYPFERDDDGTTDLWVMVPALSSGSHTAVFSVVDTDGLCSSLTIKFKTNQGNGGPT